MTRNDSLTGVILLQVGTPDSTKTSDVRRYLKEFLSDPRVMDMPAAVRWLLLRTVILPFRPRRSAEAYQKIWEEDGSPLTLHSEAFADKLQDRLGPDYLVTVGMRYRLPSIDQALAKLLTAGASHIVLVPMFPQYSSAATGTAVEYAVNAAASQQNIPRISTIDAFYDDPGFVGSVAEVARPLLDRFDPDHVLFSYHGLPEKHIRKGDPTGEWCLTAPGCCDQIRDVNRNCYRAQSFATTRAVAAELGLPSDKVTTAFQSRLAGQQWIRPFTDKILPELFEKGVRRLAVLTPSFVADCLETLEEIGIRAREQWEGLGGEDFLLVPCVNSTDPWVDAVARMVTAT